MAKLTKQIHQCWIFSQTAKDGVTYTIHITAVTTPDSDCMTLKVSGLLIYTTNYVTAQ